MNKIYKLIWNSTQQAWVVCSELGSKKKSKSVVLSGVIIGFISLAPTVHAACVDEANSSQGAAQTTGGSQCNANRAEYRGANVAWAYGNGSVLNFTQPDTLIHSLGYAGGHSLNIGGANSGSNPKESGASVEANNLEIRTGTYSNIRGIIIQGSAKNDESNKLTVKGNLKVVSNASSGGAAIESIQPQSIVNVLGNTVLETNAADGYRNSGIARLEGNLTIKTGLRNNVGTGISNTATGDLQVSGNTDIQTKNNSAIINSGKIKLDGNSTTILTTNNNAIVTNGGTVEIANLTQGSVNNASSAFIRSNGGTTTLLNVDQIESQGNIIQATGGTVNINNGDLVAQSHAITTSTSAADTTININNANVNSEDGSIIRLNNTGGNTVINVNDGTLTSENAALITVDSTATGSSEVKLTAVDTTHNGIWLDAQGGDTTVQVNDMSISGLTNKADSAESILNLNNSTWNLEEVDGSTISTFSELNLINSDLIAFENTASDFMLVGNVNANNSNIRLANAYVGDVLTIDGNYSGTNSSTIRMNTLWDGPGDGTGQNSSSDVLNITGSASGTTRVIPVGLNNEEGLINGNVEQIQEMIRTVPVINVGVSGTDAFVGTAYTTGISEVQLAKRTTDEGQDEYFWTAAALTDDTPIYNPDAANYVQMPVVNMELGYSTLGTLHERRGENQTLAWDECGSCTKDNKGQTWGRVFAGHLDLEGKNRLDLDGEQYVMQLGHDFIIHNNEQNGSRNHTGAYLSYGRSNVDFNDRLRTENGQIISDNFTGRGKHDAYSLGLYNTYYDANGSYLDLVGQASYLENKYESRSNNKISQDGWGGLVSAEIGRPFALTQQESNQAGWLIEPQAQLTYQYIRLDELNDGIRQVKEKGYDGLRGRLGARLAYNKPTDNLQTQTFYLTGNVLHDFLDQDDVHIGLDRVSEQYNDTWGSVGVGLQVPFTRHGYVYADSRYEHSFDSEKRENYRGSLGMKLTWK